MRRTTNSQTIFLLLAAALVAYAAIRLWRERQPVQPPAPASASVARLGPEDIYPDSARTPGAANPAITQENIGETICSSRWSTKRIRPPASYTHDLKVQQIEEYGLADKQLQDYEEDHLIPLEVGGDPRDPRNLWPEPYETSIADGGARFKDKVENELHDQVCAGTISLAEAQNEIATDWYRVYVTLAAH